MNPNWFQRMQNLEDGIVESSSKSILMSIVSGGGPFATRTTKFVAHTFWCNPWIIEQFTVEQKSSFASSSVWQLLFSVKWSRKQCYQLQESFRKRNENFCWIVNVSIIQNLHQNMSGTNLVKLSKLATLTRWPLLQCCTGFVYEFDEKIQKALNAHQPWENFDWPLGFASGDKWHETKNLEQK